MVILPKLLPNINHPYNHPRLCGNSAAHKGALRWRCLFTDGKGARFLVHKGGLRFSVGPAPDVLILYSIVYWEPLTHFCYMRYMPSPMSCFPTFWAIQQSWSHHSWVSKNPREHHHDLTSLRPLHPACFKLLNSITIGFLTWQHYRTPIFEPRYPLDCLVSTWEDAWTSSWLPFLITRP